jgi:hypothetical protein
MSLSLDLKYRNDKMKKLKKAKWILRDRSLGGAARYHIFQALFKSRMTYAINILAFFDKKTYKWL